MSQRLSPGRTWYSLVVTGVAAIGTGESTPGTVVSTLVVLPGVAQAGALTAVVGRGTGTAPAGRTPSVGTAARRPAARRMMTGRAQAGMERRVALRPWRWARASAMTARPMWAHRSQPTTAKAFT